MVFFALINTSIVSAASSRGRFGWSPNEILNRFVGEANVETKIQDTQLDRVSKERDQMFDSRYPIANTLNSIRMNIAPYLQWLLYFGLSIGAILIVYTWFQLVTSVQSWADMKATQARLKNIILWLLIMTWCYALIRIFLAALVYILS